MNRTIYVALLPDDVQNQIRKELTDYYLNNYTEMNVKEVTESVMNGMDGRLCDLDDVIDVDRIVGMIEGVNEI